MKNKLLQRVVSWALAVGMTFSPSGVGLAAVTSYAEDTVITSTAETTEGAQETDGESQETTETSEETTEKSEGTTGESEETTGESEETTGESEETTGESEETTGESEETTGESEETTSESEETTGESEETTGESEETTSESEENAEESENEEVAAVSEIVYGWVDNGDGIVTYTHSADLTYDEQTITVDLSPYYTGNWSDVRYIAVEPEFSGIDINPSFIFDYVSKKSSSTYSDHNSHYVHDGLKSGSLTLAFYGGDYEEGTSFTIDMNEFRFYDKDTVKQIGEWTVGDDGSYTYVHNGAEKNPYPYYFDLQDHYNGDVSKATSFTADITKSTDVDGNIGIINDASVTWAGINQGVSETTVTCSFENGLDISTTVSVGAIICSTGSTLKISNIKVYPEVEEVTYGWVDNGDDTITYTHSADLTDEQKQITIDMEQYEGDPSSIRYIGIPYERSSSNLEVSVTNGEFGTYGSNGMFYVLCPNGFSTEETFAVNLLGDVEDGAYITFDFRDAVTYDEGGIDAVGVWTYENGTYSYVHNGAEPYALKKHINLADHTDLDLTEIRSVSFDVTIDGINSGVGIWDGTDYQFVWCSASTDVKWNFPAGITGNGFFDVMPDIAEEGMTLTVSNIVVSSEASGYGWVNNGDGTLTYTHSSELTESQRKFNVDIREYYSGNYSDIRLIALPIESTGNSCAFNAEGATAHHCESNKNFVMYHYGMPSQSLVLYPSETDLENLADGTSFTLDIGSMNIYDTDNIDEVGTWTRDGDSYTYTHNGAELHGYELKINLADHYDGDLTDITGVSFAFTRTSNIFASAGLWDGSNYPYEWLDTDRNVTWSFDNGYDSDGIMTLSVYFAGGVGESVTFSDITIHTEAIEYGWKDNGDGTYTYVHSDKLTNAEKMTTIDFSEYYDGDLSKVRYVVVPAETNNDYMYVTFSDQTYGIFSTSTGSCIEFGNGISSSDMTLFMSNVSENITNGSYINFDFNNIRVYDVDTVKDIGVWTVDGNKFTYVNGSADEPFGLSCPFDLKKIIDGDLADVKAVNFEYEQNGNIYADAGMWDGSTYQWSIIGESWSENPVTWSIPNGIVNADGTGVLCGAGGTDAGASITITITADISPVGTWTDNGDGSYTYVHGDETCSGKDFTVPYAEIFDGDMSEIRSVTFDVEVKNSNATFSVGASDGNNCWQHQEFNAYDGFKQTVTMIMAYGARYDAGPNFQMWWIDAGAEITLSNFKVSAEDTGVKFNVRDYNETPLGTNADGSLDIELYTMSVSEYPRISLKGTDVVEAEVRLPSGVDSSQVYMGISISTADHTHISAYPSEKGVLSRSVSLKELADLVSISVEDITAVSVCVFNADGVITAEDKLGYTMTIRKGEDDDGTEIIYGWVINSDGIATYTHSNGLKEYDRQLNIDLSKYYDGDAADIRKVTIPYEASSDEITVFWCGSDTSKVNWTDTYSTAVFNGGRSSKDLTIAVCYAYTGLIDDISQIAEGTTLTVDLNNIVVEDVTDIDYGWVDNGDGTATYTHSASLTQEEREFTIDISKYYKGDLADAEKIYWSYVTSDENLRFFEGDNNKLWVGQYRAMYSYSEHGVGKTEIVLNVSVNEGSEVADGETLTVYFDSVKVYDKDTVDTIGVFTESKGAYKYTHKGAESFGMYNVYDIIGSYDPAVVTSVSFDVEVTGNVYTELNFYDGYEYHFERVDSSKNIVWNFDSGLGDYSYLKSYLINAEKGATVTISNIRVITEPTIFVNDGTGVVPYSDMTLTEVLNEYKTFTGDLEVELAVDTEVSNLNLPAKANSVTICGEGALIITSANVKFPVNTVIETELKTTVEGGFKASVAAGKKLTLGEIEYGIINSLTGTATSTLECDVLNADTVKTFGKVEGAVYIMDTFSGIKDFEGELDLGIGSVVSIDYVSGNAYFILHEGAAPKFTVSGAAEEAQIFVQLNDGAPVANSTVVLSTKTDISENIRIMNTDESGNDLTAFYYAKEKVIKAEYAGAITVQYGKKDSDELPAVKNYPNLELALANITDPDGMYIINLNEPVYIKNLTMPKKAYFVTLSGEDLTVGNTKLALTTNTGIYCNIIPDNKKGTLDISTAKGTLLDIGTDMSLNNLAGAANALLALNGNLTVNKVTGFANIVTNEDYVLTVNSNAKFTKLDGTLVLKGAKTTANITTADGEIILVEENGVLPKATAANVENGLTVTVDNETGYIANSTVVLYSLKSDFTEKITVSNTSEDGKVLKAFLYKKEIRAECAEAITLSDGTSERNFPNFEKAVETMTDPEADYVVTFNVPAYVSKFALPKKAKSVTLEGEALTVSVSKIAANCSLTINNTIIPDNKNGTLDISMAKNGTLTIGTEMSLNSVSGAAGSVLAVNEALTVNKLSGFASVVTAEGTELTVTGTAKFTEFDGTIRLEGAKTSANITTADGEIILAEENGVLPKATVSAVENELKVIVDNESGYIANSTVILYAGKGDITAKVKVENTDPDGRELKAFLYKKAIKAECAEAITLSDGTNERDFPNIEKAIESMTDPAAHYVVTLNSDAYCTKFAMPKNAASVTFTSNGDIKTLHIGKASSISAKCGLVFENIRVESDKKFKITANAGLTISGLYSDTLTAVSGSKKSALVWDQSFGGYDVSGFGRVIVNSDAVMGTGAKFNVSTLEIQDGGMFVVNSGSKSTIKDIIGNGGKMYFAEGFSSVTISNTASGIIGIAGAVKDGDMLFTAKKADLSVFDVTEITPEGDIEYGLINIKGKVYFRGRLLEMNGTRYTLWSEMISVIEKTNDKKADYTICVLDSTDIGEALKMPKKDTYASIAVISEGEENSSLKFTGGITLTGNTVFENVNLSSVKKGVDVKYTISAGKYDLAVRNCGLGLVSAINGTGNVELENVNITGTAKAGVLKLTGRNVITGGVTANAMTFGENAELVYFKGSKVSVSKNGIIGENTITLHLIDKLTNKYAAISAGDVIVSTLKGDYSGQFILSEGNGSYGLKLAKAKLIAE